MTITETRPTQDLSALYGQHVRIRPFDSTAKPTTRLAVGDNFGFLASLGDGGGIIGLHARKTPDEVRLFRAEDFRVELYPYLRVHVFYVSGADSYWTWCREVGGDVYDYVGDLPRCAGHAEAWQAANGWLTATEARVRETS
jgi:hypothetical protein